MADNFRSKLDRHDVREMVSTLVSNWSKVVIVGLICGILALGYSVLQTPVYRSTATLYVTSGSEDNSSAAYQGSLASQQRVSSYAQLVTTDFVLETAIRDNDLKLTVEEARSALSASASSSTVILRVAARNADPVLAAGLANGVADAMAGYVRQLETPSGGGEPLAKLTVVSPATVASSPISPTTTRNVLLGLLGGVLLGSLGVLLRSRLSDRIYTEADLANETDTPVLAVIPSEPALEEVPYLDFGVGASPAAEGFRKARIAIPLSRVDHEPRVLLVASAVAAEGKTTAALNLAASLAEAGKSVLVVDADLRKPRVAHRMGVLDSVGLTTLLSGDGTLADLVQNTDIHGLKVLASGTKPPNPAEILSSEKVGQAIEQARSLYNYVVIDSPPVLPVADASALAKWVDGTILVVRSGVVKRRQVLEALESLRSVGASVLGFVLTDAKNIDGGTYSYYSEPAAEGLPGGEQRPKVGGRP